MLVLIVLASIVFGVMRTVGLIGGTIVERKVFENSFQYSESRKSELAIWQAEQQNIQFLLNDPEITRAQRRTLKARAAALRIQIANANRQHNNVLVQ